MLDWDKVGHLVWGADMDIMSIVYTGLSLLAIISSVAVVVTVRRKRETDKDRL